MQINPPFGYTEVVPLLKTHRVRLLQRGEVPAFAQKLNAIPISYTEFAPAARDYPVVFTSGDGGKSFAPVAVLGMAAGENLYVNADGWAPQAYVPAYARRYPFCMAKKGVLGRIYAHLLSLENFSRLLERRAGRA